MINKQDVIKLIDDCINRIEDVFTADEAEVIFRIVRSKIEDMPELGEDVEEAAFDFDRAIKALKKQIPQKPVKIDGDSIRYTSLYRCPNCGQGFSGTGFAKYCYHCGQRLQWESEE